MARRMSPAAMTGWPATQKASARMRWPRLNELRTGSAGLLRKREHRQLAAEGGVVVESRVAADRAETGGRIGEACRKADAGPAADAGEHGDVLLALVRVGHHVSDDAGGSLELVELLPGLRVDRLQIALERAVEDHVARRRERARPHRELLLERPHDLALAGVPGDEVAHPAVAVGGGVHRQGGAHIGLSRGVADPERLVIHADV